MKRRDSILLALFAMVLLPGCGGSSGPATTDTSSTRFATLAEKIEFLERYVQFRRTYKDLDFEIDFRNGGSGRVPGPSEWDIQIVARVPSAEIPSWTQGLNPTDEPEIDWLDDLPGRIDRSGLSAWFGSGGRLVGVDEENAIVVYRNRAQ